MTAVSVALANDQVGIVAQAVQMPLMSEGKVTFPYTNPDGVTWSVIVTYHDAAAAPSPPPSLADYDVDDLLAEVRRRMVPEQDYDDRPWGDDT